MTERTQTLDELKRAILLNRARQRMQQGDGVVVAGPGAIPPADRGGALPLSWEQQRLWFLDRFEPSAALAYHLPAALRLRGALDREALRGALDRVVARHESLRTRFVDNQGEPAQAIDAPELGFVLIEHDLRAVPADEREASLLEWRMREARAPFDLAAGPPIRGRLLRLADDEHALLVTQHHIVSDGWSLGVLVKEVAALYTAFSQGLADPLPPLSIQYADYAAWQRGPQRAQQLERGLAHWRERLDGAPVLHELPTDRPRPAEQRFHARQHAQLLDAAQLRDLRSWAREHDATLFMALQSAFAALLSRWSGQSDIVIGTPVAGRSQAALEPLIGFFNNTLACRYDLSSAHDAAALLAQGRSVALDAFAHQDVPFDLLVETLRPQRSLAYNPLCQVKFVLQNHDSGELRLPGLVLQAMAPIGEQVRFDLDLTAIESEHGLHLNWTYKDDLFDAARIERMASAYARLLAQMVARPDARLDELVWVDEDEAAQLRALGQGPRSAARRDSVLPAQIAAQAARTPEAVAVRFGASELSYAALERASNRLAQVLAEQGMGPGARVGVHLERSLALPIALLAVMKSGAAYVPLDHRQTPQRLQAIVEDAGIDVVLLDSAHATLPIRGLDTVFVDDAGTDPDWLDGYADEAPRVALSDEDSAYVLYTSGSTGTPKGVEIRHGGLIDYCAFALEGYYAAELAGSLVVTSPAFDLTIPSLYVPLLGGGCVELMPAQDELSALTERLEGIDAPASLLRMTPSHAHGLLQLADAAPREQAHAFVIGGEAFPVELARALQAKYPHARIYNHYGPTETVVGCAWFDVSANLATLERTIPIGRPMSNTRFYVMDPSGRLQPPGVAGELYIGGAGVAKGYLNRPELSAEKFLADPFDAHARVYRSGDRVVWRGDGTLEFLGRLDDQVKLRGFRIELGDIESALLRHDEVREAVAMVRGEDRDARLVAYVVATEADDSLVARLQAHASEQLPIYMQPSAIVVLDRLPLTINGKVDKRALPEPEQVATEFVAPHNDTERALAAIWERVLRVEAIGRHDHFFELGGHSLMATRVVSDIARRFGKPLPVRALFEHATIARLGAYLDAQAHSGHSDIPRIGRDRPLPLSFAQQRLWFIDRLEGNSSQYNMPAALKFAGQLDVAALRHAMDRLVERHEVLRTTYAERDGEAVQQVQPAGPVPLRIIDLRGLEDAERKQRLDALIEEEAAHPFDLSRDLMLRVTLIPLTDNEQALLFTLHHIASDGWSMDVLVREFKALYAGHVEGRVPALADLPVQYADYAAWQRERLHGAGLQAQLDYWRGHLAGLPPVHSLPLDRPRPPRQHFAGGRINHDLDRATVDALAALGRRHEASLFMVLEAAFAALLSRWSGEDDIAVGTLIAGRVHQDIEPLIGFFVNTLVLRTDLSGDPDFIAVLTQTRTRALAAYEHQDVPFEMLVEELKPARSLAHNPLFQIAFSMRNNEQPVLELPGMAVAPLSKNEAELAMFDLQLSATEHERGMRLSWLYAQHLFDGASIERLSAAYLRLLEGVLAAPDAPMSELALLSDGDQQLIEQWNDRAQAYDRDATIHAVFEAQAAATPEASALIYDGAPLSYAELNRQANRIAHRLIAHGVKPGDNVGLCIERSFELIAATLGILKAGAAYVPFDPSYPQTRTAYMLEDSAVALVLTQSWLRDTLPEGVATLALDEDASLVQQPEHDPRLPMAASELCYVMYTSGSTGRPKGVQLPHRVIVNLIRSMIRGHAEVAQLTPTLQFATMNFDMSIYDIVSAFFTGSPLVMIAEEDRIDLPRLIAILRRERIGRVYLPTALLQPLTHVLLSERIELPDLQVVQVAGEALVITPTIREWAAHSGCPVLNLYGPTETHVVSDYRLDGDARQWPSLPSIGAPIDNARLYVLDAQRRSLPVGVVGELYIGGEDVLARGYLNRPELTEERFIADPFVAGARMYKTGDLVRWRADGTIEYLGRSDTQVKLRGFRIELGEIETVLARHAQVTDVVVTAQGEGGDKRLIAYVVSDATDHDALRAQLRQQLEAELPPYMQPSATVVLDRLPLTANGKVDTRALPAPEWQGRDYLPPQTPTEIALAQIWQQVLRLERVSRDGHFFELGGHSLLATRVVSDIARSFGKQMPVRAMFEHGTLSALAAHLDTLAHSGHTGIARARRDRPLPLSFSQQRLWFIDHLHGGSRQYHLPAALRLTGRLDRSALQRAMDDLIARHEVLRTHYVQVEGEVAQVIAAPAPARIADEDLRPLAAAARDARLRERIAGDAERPFDLARDPVLRVSLLALADDEHALLFTMHHIASDGWSMDVLVREFQSLYTAHAHSRPPELAPLAVQYADYALWQRERLQGAGLGVQLDYWRKQLAALPALHRLPLDRPRPTQQNFDGARLVSRIDRPTLAALQALARRHDASVFMLLEAAFALLLSRWSGERDIVVGTVIAGRLHKDVEPLIGFFVNTLVLRTDLSDDPDFETLLVRTRAMALAAYEHQDVPFEALVEELKPERSLSHNPLFQVAFSLRNHEQAVLTLPGLSVSSLTPADEEQAKFDLHLSASEDAQGLRLSWLYARGLFDPLSIERMSAAFERLLQAIVAAPRTAASRLAITADADRDALRALGRGPDSTLRREAALPAQIAAQAARSPEAVAVRFGEAELTYAALDRAANRLAQALRRRGIDRGARVGVHLERSLALPIALLAVMKTGAAYVPLDHRQTPQRLQAIIDDAAIGVVLLDSRHSVLPAGGFDTLELDGAGIDPAWLADGPDDGPAGSVGDDDIAYVLYTSGSTGTPKGVEIRHGGLIDYCAFALEGYYDATLAGSLVVTSPAFDLTIPSLYVPLLAGGCVELMPAQDELSALTERLEQADAPASLLRMTPSHAQGLLQLADPAPRPAAHAFVIGGESFPVELARALQAKYPNARIYNHYGPTETVVGCAWFDVSANLGTLERTIPIGRPMSNTRLYVMDEAGAMQPPGVAGELYIGGAGVAKGYLNRPELSAEKFLTDPFDTTARVYRSGDRVRWRGDGTLEFLGRLDEQVKLRGFRIELGDIESALLGHDEVRESIVTLRGDGADARLVAYVVAAIDTASGAAALPARLAAHAAAQLPPYMQPAAIVVLDRLPLTANGKVDKRALPEPEWAPVEHVEADSDSERGLVAIWREILGRDEISVTASFFDLGGHSLLVMRLVNLVRQRFQVDLPIRLVFEQSSIRNIAALIDEETLRRGAALAKDRTEQVELEW